MSVTTGVLTNPEAMIRIATSWNGLVDKYTKNPFCLTGFVKQFRKFSRLNGWASLVLVISAKNTIVGLTPIMTRKMFGFRFAKLIGGGPWLDFVVKDEYRENLITETLDLVFKSLGCHFFDLTLPSNSTTLRSLKHECRDKSRTINVNTISSHGSFVLPIDSTWNDFESMRGRNFRRRFKKMERSFDKAGTWTTICLENESAASQFQRVLKVERRSWKEEWRIQRGIEIDKTLFLLWKGAQDTARTNPDFKWRVGFLELNNQTLAYQLTFLYKEVAYFVKTSYDKRYKRFSPGKYIINSAIRQLFEERQVKCIDFLTDLPFHRTWTSVYLPRTRLLLSRKSILSSVFQFALSKERIIPNLLSLFNKIPVRT